MRILISSHLFAPSIGGIEQVSEILATQLIRSGHEVAIVTQTPEGKELSEAAYPIHRQPKPGTLFKLLRWADVYLQSNLSLGTLWPALLMRKATLVVHHTWITRPDGSISWQDRLKCLTTRSVHRNLAVSRALRETIPGECGVAPNPYRDDLFFVRPEQPRDRDLVFVGRLVSSKGADLLLEAMSLLAEQGKRPTLTIIGSGPEESALKDDVSARGLDGVIAFTGALSGEPLARELNRHRILVAPSRWAEPFGLVALEGIACGCAIVASSGGGLPDAVGSCGVTFQNGDSAGLARCIASLLDEPARITALRAGAEEHLERHHQRRVAEFYVRELSALLPRS